MIHFRETSYGFEYGSAEVTRICGDNKKGWVTIGLKTPKYRSHNQIQIYVTKAGKVRVFGKGCEWKPEKDEGSLP